MSRGQDARGSEAHGSHPRGNTRRAHVTRAPRSRALPAHPSIPARTSSRSPVWSSSCWRSPLRFDHLRSTASQDTWRAVPAIVARNCLFPESRTPTIQRHRLRRRGKKRNADGLLRPDPRASTSRTQHGISLPPVSPVTPRTPLARISPCFRVSIHCTIKRSPDGYGSSIMEDKERR